ncbi:MoaD/ThiS family protein [Gaoshiqia sediminis]|uniref:MoaD/ThiS family protein n=1 Tax=Gaoshiqia sediminis TaxID=2986998 RepID=A0AA41Y5N9_9BACT|nr:MoaD/ThiS family protein [Gaoshiqia sediminis]MCW0482310.1 MoaD/ThiS family protein [Gaoshiqia sediminis]
MMRNKLLKIKMFGIVAEKTGTGNLTIPFVDDTDKLYLLLLEKHPQLDGIKFAIAVNRQIVHQNTSLAQNDEIALLPPFSGG